MVGGGLPGAGRPACFASVRTRVRVLKPEMLGRQRQAEKLRVHWPGSLAYSIISRSRIIPNLKNKKKKDRGLKEWLNS